MGHPMRLEFTREGFLIRHPKIEIEAAQRKIHGVKFSTEQDCRFFFYIKATLTSEKIEDFMYQNTFTNAAKFNYDNANMPDW